MLYAHVPPISNIHALTRALDANATHSHALVFDDDDDDTPPRIPTPSFSTTMMMTHPHASPHPRSRRQHTPMHPHSFAFDDNDSHTPPCPCVRCHTTHLTPSHLTPIPWLPLVPGHQPLPMVPPWPPSTGLPPSPGPPVYQYVEIPVTKNPTKTKKKKNFTSADRDAADEEANETMVENLTAHEEPEDVPCIATKDKGKGRDLTNLGLSDAEEEKDEGEDAEAEKSDEEGNEEKDADAGSNGNEDDELKKTDNEDDDEDNAAEVPMPADLSDNNNDTMEVDPTTSKRPATPAKPTTASKRRASTSPTTAHQMVYAMTSPMLVLPLTKLPPLLRLTTLMICKAHPVPWEALLEARPWVLP
ncbi:hypothetical protein BDN71DRAFT_1594572 [Pleurotus eryngii]|uniref:Uncharacterized protein n=1 Tax=Pleurotus eryngii TaxID=5323 RepID=A0A9P5ZJ27_PLEER|nr:hypothetical protein BDN71DRAFT_1594572 [Pleurotus eryngii]